jgi:hypothetical protein
MTDTAIAPITPDDVFARGPGGLVLTVLDELYSRVMGTSTKRTDGKPVTTNIVYSQLPLGQPVNPADYADPWSPIGGADLEEYMDELAAKQAAAASASAGTAATGPVAGPASTSGAPAAAKLSRRVKQAIESAFRESTLVNHALVVTDNGDYLEYSGGGREISFAYEQIIGAMQPLPPPPIPAELKSRIEAARKVLYEFDTDGEIEGPSVRYEMYQKNLLAYNKALAKLAREQAAAMADPSAAEIFPMTARVIQAEIDLAWDALKTQRAEEIEAAVDTIESVGADLGQRMVARARKKFDAWNLEMAGVADPTPYSWISPSDWSDHETSIDDVGFQKLTITADQASAHSRSDRSTFGHDYFKTRSKSTSAGGGVSFFGFGAAARGGSSSSSSDSGGVHTDDSKYTFRNDGSNFEISMEYGLVEVNRPWFMSSLFHMRNWYLHGHPKHSISDGTLDSQVRNEKQLLPMVPMQLLVVRKVRIKAANWGSDSQVISNHYRDHREHSDSSSGSVGGSAGFSLGFFSVGGGASHSWGETNSDGTTSSKDTSQSDWHWNAATGELTIPGTQILGWVSHILPACPPLDDPNLPVAPVPAPN